MYFIKCPFLQRITHQNKGNTAFLSDIPTEKMHPAWISIPDTSKALA